MQPEHISMPQLAAELRASLGSTPARRLIGITGAPGAGKSTVNNFLARELGPELAMIAPMDGFHLSNEVLEAHGSRARKGAPDTYDTAGYANLLQRISAQRPGDPVIYAPRFHRDIEESIAAEIAIPAQIPLILTEGNYLLLDEGVWPQARSHLDEVWFLTVPDQTRQDRLIERRMSYGFDRDEAKRWTFGSDEDNARTVNATAGNADRVFAIEYVAGLDART